MFQRYLISGLLFFVLIVVCGFLYLKHVKHTSEKEVVKTKESVPQLKPTSPPQHNQQPENSEIDIVEQTDVSTTENPHTYDIVSDEIDVMSVDDTDLTVPTDVLDIPVEVEVPEPEDFKTTPDGYPLTPYWDQPANHQAYWTYDHKLIDHVLVKLWRQGVRNFEGGSIDDTGRVRPHYTNTLYVEWDEASMFDGTKRKYISSFLGPAGVWAKQDFFDLPPLSIHLIDYDSPEGQGIDPYAFLTTKELP